VGTDRDPVVRRKIAAAYAKAASLRALGYKGFASLLTTSAAPEHSLLKLSSSEFQRDGRELGMEVLDAYGAVVDEEREGGKWPHGFLNSFGSTIAGGTSEIQRNIIAERILGLPRG
jgi:acyl-CoA dehydrogenase